MDIVLDELQDDDLKEQLRKFREARAAELLRKQRREADIATLKEGPASSSDKSLAKAPPVPKEPTKVPWTEEGYTPAEAKNGLRPLVQYRRRRIGTIDGAFLRNTLEGCAPKILGALGLP